MSKALRGKAVEDADTTEEDHEHRGRIVAHAENRAVPTLEQAEQQDPVITIASSGGDDLALTAARDW